MSQHLTEVENALLGTVGGVIEVSLLQSLNYWKNALQQGMPLTLDPRKLYRGYGANCLNMGGVTCFQFVANGYVKKLVTGGENRALTAPEQLQAGFAAGFVSAVVCSPLELVMIQQQRKGGSILSTAAAVAPQSLRGITMCAMREGIYSAGYLGVAPAMREYLRANHADKFQSEDQARFAGAICAGLSAAYLSHPFDTIKTCMQGDVEKKTYGSVSQTASTLYKTVGLTGFYRGAVLRCTRQIFAAFILDKARVVLAPLMFPHAFENVDGKSLQ
jgi:hypothetical protein